MADLVDGLKTYGGALLEGLSRRQAYFLQVPGTASVAALSVASFAAVERFGEPYTVAGQMQLASAQDMTFSSVDGRLVATSGGALTLSCQGGYIKLDGGDIELGCPGSIALKTGNFTWQGPASLNPPMPARPVGSRKRCRLHAHAGVEAMTEEA